MSRAALLLKPICPLPTAHSRFVAQLEAILDVYRSRCKQPGSGLGPEPALRVVVVGGGAGGVEVALALQYRLEQERVEAGGAESCRARIT